MRGRLNNPDDLWTHVTISDTGCFLFTGYVHPRTGYGFWSCVIDGVKMQLAHRNAYRLAHGPIPPGLTIDHLCGVRRCVNPAHLDLCTQRENVLRSEGITARNARKTACKYGHPFTLENTIPKPDGRRCRECARAEARERMRRRSARVACDIVF